MKKAKGNGIELNARGIPARKRKKNSLIYGADDLVSVFIDLSLICLLLLIIPVSSSSDQRCLSQVSIPVKSPKKKVGGSPTKQPTPNAAREPEKFKYENNVRPKQEKFDDFYDDEDMEEDMDDDDNIGDNDKSVDFYNNAIPERIVKSVRSTPTKKKEMPEKIKTELEEEISMGNRLNAQRLGVALRNLLKLPKAHKWVCFEFFYSNIDKVLFQGENDFQVCLRESLPNLATRRLSRVEWAKVCEQKSGLELTIGCRFVD